MDATTLRPRLAGAFPAVVTPMTRDGDIDHLALRNNLSSLSQLGLAGYLMLGSTGEQVHLSEFERALVLEVARRMIPDDQLLIAGTGLSGTRQTIQETKRAAEAGADLALVVTPSYYQKGMTAANLIAHYRTVAEASPIPILLYSVPGVTGVTLPADAVQTLAPHPNIWGMKNSSSDLALAVGYRLAAEEPFTILAGSPHAAPAQLLAGLCDGVILAAANVAPEASAALMAAFKLGDSAAVRHHARILYTVADTIGKFGIAGWKAGAEARGYSAGPVRGPLRNLTAEEYAQVTEWVQDNIAVGKEE